MSIHSKTQKSPQLFLQQGEEKLWGFSMLHSLERERISFVTHFCCGAILGTLTRVPARVSDTTLGYFIRWSGQSCVANHSYY